MRLESTVPRERLRDVSPLVGQDLGNLLFEEDGMTIKNQTIWEAILVCTGAFMRHQSKIGWVERVKYKAQCADYMVERAKEWVNHEPFSKPITEIYSAWIGAGRPDLPAGMVKLFDAMVVEYGQSKS